LEERKKRKKVIPGEETVYLDLQPLGAKTVYLRYIHLIGTVPIRP